MAGVSFLDVKNSLIYFEELLLNVGFTSV